MKYFTIENSANQQRQTVKAIDNRCSNEIASQSDCIG